MGREYHGVNFTNLFGRAYFNPNYSLVADGIAVSGYGNRSNVQPQVFQPDNMVVISNGACDCACALFVHFMKYRGKVKQIAIGGRPQQRPIQAIGGTRGTQNELFSIILTTVQGILQDGGARAAAALAQVPELETISRLGDYICARSTDPGKPNVNLYNHVAQDDPSLTPLRFTFEAADCRIFHTEESSVSVSSSWSRIECISASFRHTWAPLIYR